MSKQQLTIEQLAPYLPYGVKLYGNGRIRELTHNPFERELIHSFYGVHQIIKFQDMKIILRPLSDLTNQIKHNGEKFYPIGKLHNSSYRRDGKVCKGEYEVNEVSRQVFTTKKSSFARGVEVDLNRIDNNEYWVIKYLLKWHFDVFSLIEKGLAININDLKDE